MLHALQAETKSVLTIPAGAGDPAVMPVGHGGEAAGGRRSHTHTHTHISTHIQNPYACMHVQSKTMLKYIHIDRKD